MALVYEALESWDVIVLRSPVYFGTVSAKTKLAIDRCNCLAPFIKRPDGRRVIERRIEKRKKGVFIITFIAYPGESPILDGEGKAGELLILDQHTSYVRISGFAMRNFTIWGMELSGENRYVQLDYLEVEGGEAAIRFTYGESAESPPLEGPVEHITLEDSIIHGSQHSALDCTPGPCNDMVIRRVEIYDTGVMGTPFYGSDGLEFARGYPVLVEDCYVHDNGGDGIDLNFRDRQGNATGVIVRRNRLIRNRLNGIKLWAGGRIENNVVWGQGNSAVWAGTFTSTLEIFNDTIAYNMWHPTHSERNWALIVGYPEEMEAPPVTLTLVNNIFAFNADPLDGGSTGIYLGPGVTLAREQNNLYWSREDGEITAEFMSGHDPDFTRTEIANGTWTQFSGHGQDDLTAAPLFVSGWPAVDLHLQEASPAVNTGAAVGAPTEDVNGRARDVQPDIGAYEYLPLSAQVYLPLVSHSHCSSRADIAGYAVFPAEHIWNTPVDALPVATSPSRTSAPLA